jgi:TRAP-type C4-dicarboxylate transport system permease small subunit
MEEEGVVDRGIAAAERMAAAFLAFVTALTFVSVVLRHVVHWSIPEAYDLGRNLLGIVIFWGIALAGYRGDHITVDLMWGALPARAQRVLDILGSLFTFACMAVFAYAMADKVASTRASAEATYDLRLPVWPFYLLAWSGIALSVVLLLIRLARQMRTLPAAWRQTSR